MKLRNIWLALKDQGPLRRFFVNFFVTRNAWGLFHINSHVAAGTGKPKVQYSKRSTAERAATAMYDAHFSVYKCMRCDGYHIGKNKQNKPKRESLWPR